MKESIHFAGAVDASGQMMKMRVRNVRDGQVYTAIVELRD